MDSSTDRLKILGKSVAEAIDAKLRPERSLEQRRALMASMDRKRKPGRLWWYAVPVAAALALVIAYSWYLLGGMEQRLEFRIGSGPSGSMGKLIQATKEPVSIDFQDGSRIELLAGTTGRVLGSTTKEVVFSLHDGSISARIKHREAAKWMVKAGDYRIIVVGTSFSTTWSQRERSIQVDVFEGKVLVSGPELGTHGRLLGAGESLRIQAAGKETAAQPGSAAADQERQKLPAKGEEPQPAPAGRNARNGPKKSAASSVEGYLWKQLFRQGRFAEAIESAEQLGFDMLVEKLTEDDMWLLADACRYAKNGRRAAEVLAAILRRFQDSSRTRLALFLLGRVAIELSNDPDRAAQWFGKYLQESPDGPLAEEALGLLIKVYTTMGKSADAIEAAKQYMAKYPGGIFAPLAQSVLKK